MLEESVNVNYKWFTTVISKASNLALVHKTLENSKPAKVKIINAGQGQKKIRTLGLSYF